jgi:hypothetical protein
VSHLEKLAAEIKEKEEKEAKEKSAKAGETVLPHALKSGHGGDMLHASQRA